MVAGLSSVLSQIQYYEQPFEWEQDSYFYYVPLDLFLESTAEEIFYLIF